jgi:hypothetical protein
MPDDVIGPMFEDLAGNAGKYGEQAVKQLGETVDGAAERSETAIAEVAGTESDATKSIDDLNPVDETPKPPGSTGEPEPEQTPETRQPSTPPATQGPPWPVADGVQGEARGKSLKGPHPRHTITGARNGQIKPDNTVALRGYEDAVKGDVKGIADGQATWNPATNRYEINGRSYGVEPSGTVFPDSGTGLAKLDRNEYAALKQLARADGDPSKVIAFERDPRFVNNPAAVSKAIEIYNGTHTP